MDRDQLIRALAGLIAGLEVPFSISGGKMLGVAGDHWKDIYHALNLHGYALIAEIEEKLREALDSDLGVIREFAEQNPFTGLADAPTAVRRAAHTETVTAHG